MSQSTSEFAEVSTLSENDAIHVATPERVR